MKTTLVSLLFVLLVVNVGAWPRWEMPSSGVAQAPLPATEQKAVNAASSANLQTPQEPPAELHVLVGKSLVLNSPQLLKRVSVSDPAIATAVTISPTQVLLNGLSAGRTSLILWNEQDVPLAYDLHVELDVVGLRDTVAQLFPNENIQISQSGGSIVLSGAVSSKEVADRVAAIAGTQSKSVVNLLSLTQVSIGGQILLQVRFAEVDRAAVTQLGINIFSTGAANTPGAISTGQFSPPSVGQVRGTIPGTLPGTATTFTLGDLLNIFIFRPDLNLAVTIRALEQGNVLQILAEPNLLALNGREASFLAGGEFPFPIVQPGGGFNAVTIQFKEFGVRLKFTPTLLSDGTIRLKVAPEVSALDFTNGLTVSGFAVPALSTRRAETEIELKDGQSFAIAGLIDNRLTDNASKIPGLGDIPIIGKLFRSRAINKSKTELLVMVTPKLVRPLAPGQVPTMPDFKKPFLDNNKFDGKSGETPPKKKN
ncbi:MAG TPA: type II and III secretion system protein family protein [Blastocatellia bacterium]|nr:type II and III secretion system protein family protein [Blastocatellia bacterium]